MESLIPLHLLGHQFPLGSCWLKFLSSSAPWMLAVPYSPLPCFMETLSSSCMQLLFPSLLSALPCFSPAFSLLQTCFFFFFKFSWTFRVGIASVLVLHHVCPPTSIHFLSWVLPQSPLADFSRWQFIQASRLNVGLSAAGLCVPAPGAPRF